MAIADPNTTAPTTPTTPTENSSSMLYWIIIIAMIAIVIFFFGPTIMNMINSPSNRFGEEEIGKSVTELLSNLN